MSLAMTASDYVDYLLAAGRKIAESKNYITELDSKTGDGDHWINLNMGFKKLNSIADELREKDLDAMFKRIGMTMMAMIGGSSGVLYGSAYIEASLIAAGKTIIDITLLTEILKSMEKAIMGRGKAQPRLQNHAGQPVSGPGRFRGSA